MFYQEFMSTADKLLILFSRPVTRGQRLGNIAPTLVEGRHWDPARIWTWVFWTLVRGSYQLNHWSSGIGAKDRWYLTIDTVWLSQAGSFLSLINLLLPSCKVIGHMILVRTSWHAAHWMDEHTPLGWWYKSSLLTPFITLHLLWHLL